MKGRAGRLAVLFALVLLSTAVCRAQAGPPTPPRALGPVEPPEASVPGRVLVKFRPDAADVLSGRGLQSAALSVPLQAALVRHQVGKASPLFPGLRVDQGGTPAPDGPPRCGPSSRTCAAGPA